MLSPAAIRIAYPEDGREATALGKITAATLLRITIPATGMVPTRRLLARGQMPTEILLGILCIVIPVIIWTDAVEFNV